MADQPAAERKREKLAGCPVLAGELSRPPVQITDQYFVKLKILECLSFIYNSVRSQKNLSLKLTSQRLHHLPTYFGLDLSKSGQSLAKCPGLKAYISERAGAY